MPIVTLSEGGVSELHADLKGAMNALFLQDLGAKTHRGVRAIDAAGMRSFGLAGVESVRP
jgi:hypothetical protein